MDISAAANEYPRVKEESLLYPGLLESVENSKVNPKDDERYQDSDEALLGNKTQCF